ncbi:hypothetical protein MBLNU459_g2952t1 [Dothideomycetes sp. NU459]
MFYSHEVLTSREHGIATVWLIATLGAKSTLNKKVNKKAILDVNVQKACKTILSPEVPMALRLQSNLLYGVTRVYGEKVSYVLVDAQHAQNDIRTLLKVVKTTTTELEGKHKAKPEQIMLQEDNNTLLADILGFDIEPFHDLTNSDPSQLSSVRSPHSTGSSILGSGHVDPSIGGIIIPPSASSAAGGSNGPGRFSLAGSNYGEDHRGFSRVGSGLFGHDVPGLLEDAGFNFDADGNFFETGPDGLGDPEPSIQLPGPILKDDVLVTNDHGIAYGHHAQASNQRRGENEGYLPVQDDFDMYSNVEAFPARHRQSTQPGPGEEAAQAEPAINTTESSTSAPVRRRPQRALAADENMELRNHELAQWSANYIGNMQTAMHAKYQNRFTKLAKANANFWVLQNGVGGLAYAIGPEEIPEPLRIFSGNALLAALTGSTCNSSGDKRARQDEALNEDVDVDADGRRVRARSDEAEMGRADDDIMMNDPGYVETANRDETIEIGRDAPTPLADYMSSTMPWNASASIRGSSAQLAAASISAGGHQTSSIGGGPVSSLRGRASRFVSASPLMGYGQARNVSKSLDNYQIPIDDDCEGLSDEAQAEFEVVDPSGPRISRHDEDFELFGAAAAVDTQTAGAPSWVRQALDSESANFLSFVRAGIEESDNARDENSHDETGDGVDILQKGSMLFETLLPHSENSRVVAAQAMLHVLTLATKNLLRVTQMEHFEAISLQVL